MSNSAFEAQSATVAALLGEDQRAQIVVPTFQRGYSWDKKHVDAFWKDIIKFLDHSSEKGGPEKYFLGPIVILQRSPEVIELLDGQQRLATATILFSVLRDVARNLLINDATDFAANLHSRFIIKPDADGEDVGRYALEMGEMDKLYFSETIQAQPRSEKKPTIRSHRNIKAARTFLEESVMVRIAPLDPQGQLKFLKRVKLMLQRDLVMASIPVVSERDAFMIFETLNDRGLRLSTPDLLLNYLMREAQPETDRRQIRDFWNEMLELMGKRDINQFLRHMWVSKYGDLKKEDLFTALKARIENQEGTRIPSLVFARACSEECTSYVELLNTNEDHLGVDVAHDIRSIVRMLDFRPAFPVLLSSYRMLDIADVGKIAKWLLVFITRYSIIGSLDPSGLETVLFELARDIRNKMDNATDRKAASKTCMSHVKNVLVRQAPSDEDTIRAAAKAILSHDDANYIMNRLANYMQSPNKEVEIAESNVEHIFPRKPKDHEWGGPSNHQIMEPFLWHIGNLTIFGKRLNSNAGNEEFSVKRADYAQKSEVAMTKLITKDHTEWDVTAIESRARKLAPLVAKVWDFDNPSRV